MKDNKRIPPCSGVFGCTFFQFSRWIHFLWFGLFSNHFVYLCFCRVSLLREKLLILRQRFFHGRSWVQWEISYIVSFKTVTSPSYCFVVMTDSLLRRKTYFRLSGENLLWNPLSKTLFLIIRINFVSLLL